MFSGFMVNAWEVGDHRGDRRRGGRLLRRAAGFGLPGARHPQRRLRWAAGANLIGINPLVGLGVFSLLAALGIGSLGRRGRPDVVTALALVMMLALGAAFLSQSTEYEPQIFSLLFGEILGVSSSKIVPVAVLGLVCVVAVAVLYRRLMLTSIAPEIAAARGIRPHRIEMAFSRGPGVRHHDDGAGRRRPPDLHLDDRTARRGPMLHDQTRALQWSDRSSSHCSRCGPPSLAPTR